MKTAVIAGVLFIAFGGRLERAVLQRSGVDADVRPQGVLKIDPATAGTITGRVTFEGTRSARELLDMSANRYCVSNATEHITVDSGQTTSLSFTFRKREQP